MSSPYIVGSPVSSADLYGRDDFVHSCYADLPKNNLWILGRRRLGKTSVLYALKELALEKKEWFPVFLDLSPCDSEREIQKEFLSECLINLKRLRLKEDYQVIHDKYNFVDLIKDFHNWLQGHGINKLVLLMDEIEQLENLEEGHKIANKLRVLGSRPDYRLVIAASRVFRTRKRSMTSDFIGIFKVKYLGSISHEDTKKLILQEKNEQINIKALDEITKQIITLSASEPYLCQYLCDKLYDIKNNCLRSPTDRELSRLDVNLNQILTSDYEYLQEHERKLLLSIVNDKQLHSMSNYNELIDLGYIRKENGNYRIGNHFFETWLRRKVKASHAELNPTIDRPDDANENFEVFLSYSNLDKDQARVICELLEEKEITYFLSEKSVQPGEHWESLTKKHLKKSNHFWVLITPNSIKSEWVTSEWGVAWAMDKRIVPILFRCSPEDIPKRLQSYQCIDFHEISKLVPLTKSSIGSN